LASISPSWVSTNATIRPSGVALEAWAAPQAACSRSAISAATACHRTVLVGKCLKIPGCVSPTASATALVVSLSGPNSSASRSAARNISSLRSSAVLRTIDNPFL